MPDDYTVRPSRYTNQPSSPPLTIRLPVGLLEQLDEFATNARAQGYDFVTRSFVIREALEAYLVNTDTNAGGQ